MWKKTKICELLCIWLAATVVWGACTSGEETIDRSEMQAFESFFAANSDSVSIAPRMVRTRALQRMRVVKDSLVRYNYLAVALKTCLITSDIDSAWLMIRQIEEFTRKQPFSPQLADLQSECLNMKGNISAKIGHMDSAEVYFKEAYEHRMRGKKVEVMPDILMNLADASNRLGKLDEGAAWYRRALLLCDSLQMASGERFPVYYGLAQIYVALRDFEQCDYYYNLAAQGYADMLPFEKHIYLNNRNLLLL